jgi:hypothetical protein
VSDDRAEEPADVDTMTDERPEDPTKSTVRYRPDASPYDRARGWEAKCHRPGCGDPFGWTWHLNWWHAMGRAWAHLRTCQAIAYANAMDHADGQRS